MVQWLKLCASTPGGTGSIPDQGTNILQAAQSETKQKYVVSSKCIIVKNGLNRASGKMPAA